MNSLPRLRLSLSAESLEVVETALTKIDALHTEEDDGTLVLLPADGDLTTLAGRVRGLLGELRAAAALNGPTELSLEEPSCQPLSPRDRVRIAGRFVIGVPPLEVSDDEVALPLAQRSASDDGRHPATALALLRLQKLLGSGLSPRRVLDARCGNGVLTMAAAALWPEAVVHAVDARETARKACVANVEAAGVNGRVRVASRFDKGPFELTVAHLSTRPLMKLAAANIFAGGCRLVVAGFPCGDVDRIERQLFVKGWFPLAREELGGWAEILFEKREND